MPCVAGVVQDAGLLEELAQLAGVVRPELLAVPDRQLEGGALQVIQQDLEVSGLMCACSGEWSKK